MGHAFMLKYGSDEMKEKAALDHYSNGVPSPSSPVKRMRFISTFMLYPEHIKSKILSTKEADSFRNLYKGFSTNES